MASDSSIPSGSPSSSFTWSNYQVFLSFRGRDVRHNFLEYFKDKLRVSGIDAFTDSDGIKPSEEFNPKLREIILRAEVCIPIFSDNFPESKTCMKEVKWMVDFGKTILPIFYGIAPSVVRKQLDQNGKFFRKHIEDNVTEPELKLWKSALVKATRHDGEELTKIEEGYHGLIDKVIGRLWDLVRMDTQYLPKHFVDISQHVGEVLRKLDIKLVNGEVVQDQELTGKRVVVIQGQPGIGKTTLAKAVYNKIRPLYRIRGSCFLPNVRCQVKKVRLIFLQEKLIKDLQGQTCLKIRNSVEGAKFIRYRFRGKGVFIVLDDADSDWERIEELMGGLDWLGQGSKVLVTTNKRDIIHRFEGADQVVVQHEVEALPIDKARVLFCKHAFRNDKSDLGEFADIAGKIISLLQGNPHYIELVGKILNGKDNSTWIKMWEQMLEAELEESMEKLTKLIYEVSDIMEESDEEHFADRYLSLKEMQLATRNHIIGIDHQVLGLIESANRGIDGVLMIGICHTTKTCQGSSPRGVGSTTLAKAVYSRVSSQFDACCFLEDIAEAIAPPGGIRPLQFKLIHDILGEEYEDDTSYEDAFEVFKEVLHQMKVLIVLDGVEDVSHITNFIGKELKSCLGLGSWIIVTSRGNNVITESLGADLLIYKSVNLMETKVAVELFNWHAFGKAYCETKCSEFVEPIVSKLLGCPLLIEFVGSLLHGEDLEAFEQLSELKLTCDFWEVLAVLHGELDEWQKQIFLDVACFASNEDVQTAKYMWHEWLSWYSGKTLMPFAKVGADDRLWMHSSLRRFGRELVDEKKNSGLSSHVYDHQSAMDILKNERGREKIEALCLGFDDKTREEFTEKNFHKMSELRFLILDSAVITGDFRGVFQKLRWLQWRRCHRDFKATHVDTKDLLILDLSGSAITEDWKGWENITLINVKVLNLSGCEDLLLTPNFTKSPELERLILEGCARLVHIDPSIGTLKHLVSLNLKSCQELNTLPQELGELVHLRELLIDGTGVETIPDLGKLINLEILSCLGCIRLRCLPDSVGKLERLQKLSIRDCQKVQQLPESIGEVKNSSLVELDISGTGIAELKNTISKLQSLKVLRMDSCFISELPSNIEHLTSLEELHASRCRNLKKIPPQIGKLKNLRILELRHASISALPVEVSNLDKLEMLDISHCGKDISDCDELEMLDINDCDELEMLDISDCDEDISDCDELEMLDISHCDELEQPPQLPLKKYRGV